MVRYLLSASQNLCQVFAHLSWAVQTNTPGVVNDAGCSQQRRRPRQSRHNACQTWMQHQARVNTTKKTDKRKVTLQQESGLIHQESKVFLYSDIFSHLKTQALMYLNKYLVMVVFPEMSSSYLRAPCTWGLPGPPCWPAHPTKRPWQNPDPWENVTPTPGNTVPHTRPGCTTVPGMNLEHSDCVFT